MPDFQTFQLPDAVTGSSADEALGQEMLDAWRARGMFQVAASVAQEASTRRAMAASKRFFKLPPSLKSQCVSDLCYSGYTAGPAEAYTICKDIPLGDPRVKAQWPCHGPVPWPDSHYQEDMTVLTGHLGQAGDKLLKLLALGLMLDIQAFTRLAQDGWHHMRMLRFPAQSETTARGLASHTDSSLLTITAQDETGGLYIRPPVAGEARPRNWLASESSAGMYEHEEPWAFVKPQPGVFAVLPGDLMQFMTNGFVHSTPSKVRLSGHEQFAMAYFHEPNFNAVLRPHGGESTGDFVHYGSHFAHQFVRSRKDRATVSSPTIKTEPLSHDA